MPGIQNYTLGGHVEVARYEVEIHPNGEWAVHGVKPDGKNCGWPIAEGRGSRRGDGRLPNARRDADAAIDAHKRARAEWKAYQQRVTRYSVRSGSEQ